MTYNTSLRIPVALSDAVDIAAHQQTRTRTNVIVKYIREGLRRDGLLTDEPEPVKRASATA